MVTGEGNGRLPPSTLEGTRYGLLLAGAGNIGTIYWGIVPMPGYKDAIKSKATLEVLFWEATG
jgi:hypothetical protein